MCSRKRPDRGAATVEAALNLVIFVTLVFGIIGMGWGVFIYNQVSELAREATRYAVVRGAGSPSPASAADIQQFVLSRSSGLNPNNLTVTTTWTPDKTAGSVVKIQVAYSLSPLLPLIPQQVLTLKSTSQMVISQ